MCWAFALIGGVWLHFVTLQIIASSVYAGLPTTDQTFSSVHVTEKRSHEVLQAIQDQRN